MSKVTVHIEGMSCSHCLNAVNKALHAVPGISVASVQMGRAEIEVPEGGPAPQVIADAIKAVGYPATAVQAG